jgi:hypothetical protein
MILVSMAVKTVSKAAINLASRVAFSDALRLRPEELRPGRSDAAWRRVDPGGVEDLPDRGGPDLVAESGEFAMNAAVSPDRVLGSQAQDQAAEPSGDGGSTGPGVRHRPAVGDELAVPPQDGSRGDEQPEAPADREQPGEGSDQGAISPAHPRARRAPLEHRELVAQDQDLDLLGRIGTGAQGRPAQQLGEHSIDQHQHHRLIMMGRERRRTGRSTNVRGV